MCAKVKSETGTFRELRLIYKNIWIKTKQGKKWTKWDWMFFQFGLTIALAALIISVSIATLYNN